MNYQSTIINSKVGFAVLVKKLILKMGEIATDFYIFDSYRD